MPVIRSTACLRARVGDGRGIEHAYATCTCIRYSSFTTCLQSKYLQTSCSCLQSKYLQTSCSCAHSCGHACRVTMAWTFKESKTGLGRPVLPACHLKQVLLAWYRSTRSLRYRFASTLTRASSEGRMRTAIQAVKMVVCASVSTSDELGQCAECKPLRHECITHTARLLDGTRLVAVHADAVCAEHHFFSGVHRLHWQTRC